MLKEFRDFIIKGNAIDLAVGVLIGAAFGGFVTAFTEGIIKPLINAIGGKPDVAWKVGIFDLGIVISAIISLTITGAVLFFIFVKPMNKLKERVAKGQVAAPPEPSAQEKLLTEIRDLLKEKV